MKPKAFAPSASAEWRAGSGNVAMRAGDGGGGSPALHKPKARKRGDTAVPAKRGLRPRRSSPCDRGPEQATEPKKAIGRASCRERVWQYVEISVGDVSLR